ncbi:unnamed protein product [Urochloa humidicola]
MSSPPPPARPPPPLSDDLIEEILARFPPADPALLVRTALVCKGWCRILSGAGGGFRCRFRLHHRTRPLLFYLYHRVMTQEATGPCNRRSGPARLRLGLRAHVFAAVWRPRLKPAFGHGRHHR